jgi:hypothetical protein
MSPANFTHIAQSLNLSVMGEVTPAHLGPIALDSTAVVFDGYPPGFRGDTIAGWLAKASRILGLLGFLWVEQHPREPSTRSVSRVFGPCGPS